MNVSKMNVIPSLKISLVFLMLALASVSFTANAQSSDAESKALANISAAQKRLSRTENRIANNRKNMVDRLNTLEREVISLREKTAVARRLTDEKTLSLSNLEDRLDGWRQQQTYQTNLLHRFLQQYGRVNLASQDMNARVQAAVDISANLHQRFYPSWGSSVVILDNGSIEATPLLSIGPVNWYWQASNEKVGFASVHESSSGVLQSDALLDDRDSKTVSALRARNQGEIIFDPTLTRALAQQRNSESLLQHLMKGGMWVVPILLFALFALSIALIKALQLWRLPKLVRFTPGSLLSMLEPATKSAGSGVANTKLLNGKLDRLQIKGMQRQLVEIANSTASEKQRDDQLFVQLQDDRHTLERWIGAIAITAAVSPLLGLLGTVSGMIETFKMMTLFGSGDPEVVSGGIAQALVTTELGLVVAIPALVLNALLSRKAKSYYNDLENFAVLLSKGDETQGHNDILTSSVSRPARQENLSESTPENVSPEGLGA